MHERERHRIILTMLQGRPVATVAEFVAVTDASEATIRRDLSALARQNRLRKLRGGAEALHPPTLVAFNNPAGAGGGSNLAEKRAIGRKAVDLCTEGDAIILNAGTTTFQMAVALTGLRMQVLTNSFAIAEHLLRHSQCTVFVPSGAIDRGTNIILSPFEDDGTVHFRARRMFMGAQGLSRLGIMEHDALTISSERRLMRQADELTLLVDASKFQAQSSMILAPLTRARRIITDSRITALDQRMIEDAGLELIVAEPAEAGEPKRSPSLA